uniref:LicD/FKTN/FKRP nucleotidyltransferase domain-containing protein n=1 Tax=Globisporangium ultimum (strain ATCC 200006 / CBS 805.95 / DAOM BR144) TaxID=431595 RepID=K3WTB7_GLOUD
MLPAHSPRDASKPRRWLLARMLRLRVWSLRRLLVTGVALCVIVKATYEMFFVRYVNGKRCERLGRVHLERGFHNPSDCFSSGEVQQIILGLVFAIADVFERNNVTYWLDSGTLLGAYREDAVILYDDDADIGIDEATYVRLRDGDEHLAFPSVYELHLHGAKFREQGRRDPGIPGRLVHTKSGIYVDMFVFLESKTAETDAEPMFGPLASKCFHSCVRCPKVENRGKEFKIPKSWVFPLNKCFLGGREVSCPAQSEKYLDYLYGPNYMTPS